MKKYLFALTAFVFTAMVTNSLHSAVINIERYDDKVLKSARKPSTSCPEGYLSEKPIEKNAPKKQLKTKNVIRNVTLAIPPTVM